MKIYLIGASGLTGMELQNLLIAQFSENSLERIPARAFLLPENFDDKSLTFLCTEEEVSRKWMAFLEPAGGYVIDLSSAFRLAPDAPLVIPEVNGHLIQPEQKFYASPNCTTTILIMGLLPIWKQFGLEEVYASSYQSVSGAGKEGVEQLHREREGMQVEQAVFPRPIYENYFPQIGRISEDRLSEEERKVILETRKILNDSQLRIGVVCVRVPTIRCHALSVFVKTQKPVNWDALQEEISRTPGLQYTPDYATPKETEGKDEVFLGRLRQFSQDRLSFWVIGDNLRKGGATNAFQIAMELLKKVKECSKVF